MASSSSGKSVARAAATGGGRTYRGQRPLNWYAGLALIVILGIGSIVIARIDYQKGPATTAPTIGTTWHTGFAFDLCGTTEPAVAASPSTSKSQITTSGSGLMVVAPTTSAYAGNNATLDKFVSGYTGMELSSDNVKYPGTKPVEYKSGETCPKGTPDAGKTGVIRVRYWNQLANPVVNKKTHEEQVWPAVDQGVYVSGDPSSLKLTDGQLITIGFGPQSESLPKPPGTTIAAVTEALENPNGTTTTLPTTATTVPATGATTATTGATAPTAPASTGTTTPTTSPATTTTAPTDTTTTTKK